MKISGIFQKLTKAFEKDSTKYRYLQDLIVLDNIVDKFAADALLWLKRGLQLICIFFENIFKDGNNGEVLKKHLQDAYDKTLKPYHGFVVQSTIKVVKISYISKQCNKSKNYIIDNLQLGSHKISINWQG